MYDNSLKSDIGFYGLSSVNLYDKGAKVAGLNVVKMSSDDEALRLLRYRFTENINELEELITEILDANLKAAQHKEKKFNLASL